MILQVITSAAMLVCLPCPVEWKPTSTTTFTVEKLTMSELAESIALLSNARSQKRVSGAKRLRKLADASAGPSLLAALREEMNDPRTWEAKYHMILALGFVGDRDALPLLWDLTRLETDECEQYPVMGVDLAARDAIAGKYGKWRPY